MNDHVKRALRFIFRAAAVLLAALAVFALWRSGLLSDVTSVSDLRAIISRAGPLAWLTFFLLQLMAVVFVFIPSNVTMLAGALALGFGKAMLLGTVAIVCGSFITFFLARKLGRGAVQRLVDRGVLEKYLPLIEEKQDMFLFLTLLFPFFPDNALCLLAGLTSMPVSHFAVIVVIARPWGLAVAALVGGGVIRLPAWGWAALLAAMAAAFFLLMKYSGQIEAALLDRLSRLPHWRRKS